MSRCSLCQREFDASLPLTDPATEMGAFLAKEMYADSGELCPQCLASRGRLAMMYLREFD